MSLGHQLAPHLPFLRRFARAFYGDQATGDAVVRITLDRLTRHPSDFPRDVDPRIALYGWFLEEVARSPSVGSVVAGQALDETERVAALRLSAMSAPARQALLLTAMEGFSHEDAGHLLGVRTAEVDVLVKTALAEIERQTRATVLIIEDEPIMAMDIEAVVRDLGHEVAGVATTRVEAVTLARATKPRLVLADVALADDSSGIDAVNEILAEMQASVIFVTAFPERLLTGDRPQPATLITKPFRRSTLKAAISQALFFDGDFSDEPLLTDPLSTASGVSSDQVGDQAAQEAIAALSADLAAADVVPLTAPVQVEVQGGRLVSAPAPTTSGNISAGGIEALRRQHHGTASRLASTLDGANLGAPFTVRLRSIEQTLATSLDDASFICLGVQVQGLHTMRIAIHDHLADERAADVDIFVKDVGDFAWTSKAYRTFVGEADRAARLEEGGRAALIHLARTLEAQDEEGLAPDLRAQIEAARINAQDDVEPETEFALRRLLANIVRAAARFVRDRITGTASHVWPSFDKELGERVGKTLSWIVIAGAGATLLARLLPAEFGAAGLLARLVKLLLD